ncbi:hypothetical protein GQ457_08G034150 [Hibiscus cannabinus]
MEELKLQLAPAAPKRADPGPGRVGARVTGASKRRRFTGELYVLSFFSDNSDDRRRGTPLSAAIHRHPPASFPTCKVITVKPSSSTFTPSERICEIVVRSSRKRTRTFQLLPLRSEDLTVGWSWFRDMWFLSPRSTFSPLEIVNGGSDHQKLASTVWVFIPGAVARCSATLKTRGGCCGVCRGRLQGLKWLGLGFKVI